MQAFQKFYATISESTENHLKIMGDQAIKILLHIIQVNPVSSAPSAVVAEIQFQFSSDKLHLHLRLPVLFSIVRLLILT